MFPVITANSREELATPLQGAKRQYAAVIQAAREFL